MGHELDEAQEILTAMKFRLLPFFAPPASSLLSQEG